MITIDIPWNAEEENARAVRHQQLRASGWWFDHNVLAWRHDIPAPRNIREDVPILYEDAFMNAHWAREHLHDLPAASASSA